VGGGAEVGVEWDGRVGGVLGSKGVGMGCKGWGGGGWNRWCEDGGGGWERETWGGGGGWGEGGEGWELFEGVGGQEGRGCRVNRVVEGGGGVE